MRKVFIFIGLIVGIGLFVRFASLNLSIFNQNNVLGSRTYPRAQADIKAKTGGKITVEGITLIVSEGTFDEDVYFRVDKTLRKNPISVDGLWQITDIYEARVKYMSNNDQVNEYAAHKNYILSFPYTTQFLTTDQGVGIPESSLKIIRGETAAGPWIVMNGSVLDTVNKTLSIITNRGGFFIIAGGFYLPSKNTSSDIINDTRDVPSKITGRTVILKENEMVVTIVPTLAYITTTKAENNDPLSLNKIQSRSSENHNILTKVYLLIRSFFAK